MRVSIVVPCHNEEDNIVVLYRSVLDAVRDSCDFEIVFVDDGSADETLTKIKDLRKSDRRVKFISMLTNYGHQKALMAGLEHCKHDFAVTMDADLQHPARYIPLFLTEQRKTGAHVVVGRRHNKQGGAFKGGLSAMFYSVFSWITRTKIVPGASDFRLYTRKALDVLCAMKEHDPFLRGMVPSLALKTHVVDYEMHQRHGGVPSYTLAKSARLALQAILRFSNFPVRLALALGLIGVIVSVCEALHYLYLRLFTDKLVPGQAELMVFVAFVGSITIMLLALLYRLLSQILDYLRRQPLYVVEEIEMDD